MFEDLYTLVKTIETGDYWLTVYLDMLYVLNVLIDYLLLTLTARILNIPYKKRRILLAACVGGLIVIFLFTPMASFFYHPIFKICLSFMMVYIAFSYTSIGRFLHHVLTFYFMTFIVGGGMIALHFLFQTEFQLVDGIFQTKTSGMGDPVSWLFVCISFPLLYIFSRKRMNLLSFHLGRTKQMVDVLITIEEKRLECRGLIDTGNQLYDPLTNKPVLILSKKAVETLFTPIIVSLLKNQSWQELIEHSPYALRFIPFTVIGKETQLLPITKPTHLLIDGQFVDGYIGLTHIQLSEGNEFLCIVHPKMMQEVG